MPVHTRLRTQAGFKRSQPPVTPSDTMSSFLVFAVLCTTCLVTQGKPGVLHYSFSRAVGPGSGDSFSSEGDGMITGIRVWEVYNAYIAGIQVRYDYVWTKVAGREYGHTHELNLTENEKIIQVSGKFHTNYIYQLIFVTSRGRSLIAGQPLQRSFNFYPKYEEAGLIMLSGRSNSAGITSLAAHWGSNYVSQDNTTANS